MIRYVNAARLRAGGSLLLLAALGAGAPAWEPTTHVYLAEIAIDEMLHSHDNKLTIYATDYLEGHILRDTKTGTRIVIGRYEADPRYLKALQTHRAAYIAGTCGPDAFPDILTGQEMIHPAGKVTPGQERHSHPGDPADINRDLPSGPQGPGSNRWLEHLYDCTFGHAEGGSTAYNTDADRAFALGFLAHSAGDMYAHTFINHYTGAPFNFQSAQGPTGNAVRHIVLESYIFDKTPALIDQGDFGLNLGSGVDAFIYDNMIRGDRRSPWHSVGLLQGSALSKNLSTPAFFCALRDTLQGEVDAYNKKNALEKAAYDVTHPFFNLYIKAWIADIDSGLRALPDLSRVVAGDLFFRPRAGIDSSTVVVPEAEPALNDYVNQHLLSMSGFPDIVGQTRGTLQAIRDAVLDLLGLTALKEALDNLKIATLDATFKAFTGHTYTEIQKYLKNPATYIEQVMSSSQTNQDGGDLIHRTEVDAQLHLAGGFMDYEQFPAAYNTVTMIKLSLLSETGMRQLLNDLEGTEGQAYGVPANAMLGFVETLDGSNQWKANDRKMFLAKNPTFYRLLFMKQPGETPYSRLASLKADILTFRRGEQPEVSAPTADLQRVVVTIKLPRPAAEDTEVTLSYRAVTGNTDARLRLPFHTVVPKGADSHSLTCALPIVHEATQFRITAGCGNDVSADVSIAASTRVPPINATRELAIREVQRGRDPFAALPQAVRHTHFVRP
ncbi:MAG: hypothetical protein HYR64_03000 [Fimbriimonas ginsengisoli]|uniref:Phospholipase C/D domain-containing protein n=1 Tax=Fimbriimonas ginsengisoli TaxID=1005039 RepID=A0A931LZG4_FIMGI|nr:hypothetical protein [Fimbriimonas ginsengisoli]